MADHWSRMSDEEKRSRLEIEGANVRKEKKPIPHASEVGSQRS